MFVRAWNWRMKNHISHMATSSQNRLPTNRSRIQGAPLYRREAGNSNALIPEERVDRIAIVELYRRDTDTRNTTVLVGHPLSERRPLIACRTRSHGRRAINQIVKKLATRMISRTNGNTISAMTTFSFTKEELLVAITSRAKLLLNGQGFHYIKHILLRN